MADAIAIPRALSITACPNCGYSLRGLEAAGTCPECGRRYDQSAVVLYGFARGSHENVANAKGSRLAWVVLIAFIPVIGPSFENLLFGPANSRDAALTLALLGASLALVIYEWSRRQNAHHPGLTQVRLDAQGCVQYDDLAGSSVLRDVLWAYGWAPAAVALPLLALAFALHWIGIVALVIWLAIATAIGVLTLQRGRQFRRALRELGEGPIADVNAAYCRRTPWSKIRTGTLRPLGADSYRLQLSRRLAIVHEHVVDAEVHCTAEQARELQQLLRDWIAPAKL